MTKHLGELDDDDLVMFVVEHLKDHKGPQKLVEGLEPVSPGICAFLVHMLTQYSMFRSWRKRPSSLRLVFGGK